MEPMRGPRQFGEAGVVEAASLEGYYTFLAMVMNGAIFFARERDAAQP